MFPLTDRATHLGVSLFVTHSFVQFTPDLSGSSGSRVTHADREVPEIWGARLWEALFRGITEVDSISHSPAPNDLLFR